MGGNTGVVSVFETRVTKESSSRGGEGDLGRYEPEGGCFEKHVVFRVGLVWY